MLREIVSIKTTSLKARDINYSVWDDITSDMRKILSQKRNEQEFIPLSSEDDEITLSTIEWIAIRQPKKK